jgi:hypothetical protein
MVDPRDVLSPKNRLRGPIEVIKEPSDPLKEENYSVARFIWDGGPAVGVRWNGDPNNRSDIGNPQSRGLPTWFILPEFLSDLVVPQLVEGMERLGDVAEEGEKLGVEARIEMVVERVLRRLECERAGR